MKRALITGGAGFIGANLALELQSKGVEVVVLDDFSSGHFENLRGFSGDVIAADVFKPADWIGRVGAVDTIFHQAAITDTTVTDQKRMHEVNVEGLRNILSFSLETGVRRVVYASSAGVYGCGKIPMTEGDDLEPMNVYGFSKKVQETVGAFYAAEEPALTVVGLRYFNVFGPRENNKGSARSMILQLFEQMSAGRRPRIFNDGEQFRDHIYVKDVVAANLKAADAKQSGVYNVCTGKTTTFNRIIEVLNGVLGTSYEPEYFENPYSFYQNQTHGAPESAKNGIGFSAGFSFEEGVGDYFKDQTSEAGGRKPAPQKAGV